MLFAIIVVCALATAWTVYPLLNARGYPPARDEPHANSRTAAWKQEKDRLVAEMVALDVALSEGRIDQSDHSEQRNRLMTEAEDAAASLGKSRAAETATPPAPKSYKWVAIAVAAVVLLGAGSASVLLNQNDVKTAENPHANGSIPLPTTAAGAPPGNAGPAAGAMADANGAPDIAAMVAKLESRVKEGNPTVDDVIMLARSYRVLNRDEESITLYRKAQAMTPDDPAIKLVLASALVRSDNDGYRSEGEKIVDGILSSDPKKPEALWLKSIGQVRRHEIEDAKKTLTQLSGIVPENSEAKNAVTGLLKELETASAGEPPAASPSATPPATGQSSGTQSK